MSAPLALIKASRAWLLADADINTAFGQSTYMTWVPSDANYPLLTITDGSSTDDRSFQIDASALSLYVDVWARWGDSTDPANVFVRQMADAIAVRLDEAELVMPDFALSSLLHTQTQPLPEPSTGIERMRVSFSATLERL